ncbi:hypothetical protein SAMD00019534_116430 [Acytostelium subglobosum LB1]|uniref:hypothetical protein n=1 Tax=Acytostelium subglobosum LB1 TaxID=1410327 RepID=UPI0006450A80|nr:hypothetical protein SAMD00019534_116430 [Acytostelium subglobosum LB1]GAM28467.1 hypothetical protein SAMD00019534_116430 [Acytostelium subglobosum LB1]|eukprot:XP_012748506.1 hypothetical protein SAMD00019534_116430 [Acytostelium subglobosum LB1]
MFNGQQYVMFGQRVATQAAPYHYDASVVDSNNDTLPWNVTFSCATLPTLSLSMHSGPFVRNRVFPATLRVTPPTTDNFQATVLVNDPFNEMFGEYTCASQLFVCQLSSYRKGPAGAATSSLLLVLLYPKATDVGDYTQPINLTVTNTFRTANIIFPPLTNNTATVTDSANIFLNQYETGVVLKRPNPNFGAIITSKNDNGLYFVNTNVSASQQFLSYFKAFKPIQSYIDGRVDNLMLATIQFNQIQIFEAFTSPSPFIPYIKPPYKPLYTQSKPLQVTNWTEGTQFGSSFLLPNYRSCYFGYLMLLVGQDDSLYYPFGVTNVANGGNTTISFTYYNSAYTLPNSRTLLDCYYSSVGVYWPTPFNLTDNTPPVAELFEILPLGGTRFLLRGTFSDAESGVARIAMYFSSGTLYYVDITDLYDGNQKYGKYEKLLELNYKPGDTVKYDVMMMNGASNVSPSNVGYNSFLQTPQGFSTGNYVVGAEDFTVFYFDKYEMNVTTTSMNNKLYFGCPKILPSWNITLFYGSERENPNYIAYGTYDVDLGLFVVPFTVPARTITRQMQYYIRAMLPPGDTFSVFKTKDITGFVGTLSIDGTLLQKQFPTTSIVNIKSQLGDEMPPMITDCTAMPGKTVDLTTGGNQSIGWKFFIQDSGNGFLRGVIRVISEIDGEPRRFEFTPANRTGGDQYAGYYQIMFGVDSNFRSQTFTFLDIELFDNSMNRGFYSSFDVDTRVISPLTFSLTATRVQEFNIKLLTATTDVTAPVLETLELLTPRVDVGSHARNIDVRFTVRESGTGYSKRHMPLVYLTGYVHETYKLTTTSMSQVDDVYTFTASGMIPYAFATMTSGAVIGGSTLAFISVYGLVDNSQNINGYSTEDLPVTPLVARTVEIVYTHITPILERAVLGQGVITVIGKNFGPTATLVDALNIGNATVLFTKTFGSVVIAVFNVSNQVHENRTLTIQLRNQPDNSTYYSNNLTVRYVPPPNIPVITCPGTPPCSGNGYCSPTFGCQCIGTWYGDDCSSQAVPIAPVINPESPSTVYTFNETGVIIVGEIEIVRVRVLDQLGAELASYPLNQWNTSSTSNQSRDYLAQYGPDDLSNVGLIKVNVRWFTEDENITFAGDILPMKKNTIKYTISLSNYTFPSQLDSMQVVMRATINTTDANSCSIQQYGYTDDSDGNKDNLFWMRVKVQSYSVYGHFIQKAMVDGRVSAVSNVLLNDTVQTVNDTQSSQTLIGINVSAFTRQAYLDPDFQLLLDTDDAKGMNGAFCKRSSSSSSKLSPLAIAGIVVLCICFVAAIVVAIVMRRRSLKKEQKEVKRINMKLSQLKSQQNQS